MLVERLEKKIRAIVANIASEARILIAAWVGLVFSMAGLIFFYFGEPQGRPASLVNLETHIDCVDDTYIVHHALNATPENPYLAIHFIPVGRSPKNDCNKIEVGSSSINFDSVYLTDQYDGFSSELPPVLEFAELKGSLRGAAVLEKSDLDGLGRFTIVILDDDLYVNHLPGKWSVHFEFLTRYLNGVSPDLALPNELAILFDHSMTVSRMSPAMSFDKDGSSLVDEMHYHRDLSDKHISVAGHTSNVTLNYIESGNQVVNGASLSIYLEKPNYESLRDLILIVLSSFLGVSLGIIVDKYFARQHDRSPSVP